MCAVHWESGDIAQLTVPGDPTRPRDYSIASIPEDGACNCWCARSSTPTARWAPLPACSVPTLPVGGALPLRVRPHRNFRLGDNAARP